MKRNLDDKGAWITGAGSGIGQNAAVTLSKLGMKVILSGRNIKNLQETALKCENDPIIKTIAWLVIHGTVTNSIERTQRHSEHDARTEL